MQPRSMVIYCGLLMSAGAFSIDITLPSFPEIQSDLSTNNTLVQWTITSFLITAGLGQLIWGGVADKYGRKPALAAGLSIYLAGCLLAALAPNIEILLGGRALQGLGGAAAMVCSRAIIRDLFSGDELARSLALATAIFAAGPIIAPLAGGLIAEFSGWRMIFALLSVYACMLLVILYRLPETNQTKTADATKLATIARRSKRLIFHPQSRHFLAFAAIVNSSIILILASLPVIYDVHFGITGLLFSVFFAAHGLGIIVGQVANRRLIRNFGPVPAMIMGGIVLVVSATLMLIGGVAETIGAYSMSALFVLFATSYLIVYANSTAMVLDPHGDMAGFAASFFGFVGQIGASLIASVLLIFTGDSIVAFAAILLGICVISLAGNIWWQSGAKARLRAT